MREVQLAANPRLGMFEFENPFMQFAEGEEACVVGGQRLIAFSITYDVANARVRLSRQRAR